MLAYPIRYNSVSCEWEQVGRSERVLFIITEQHKSQILKMIIAYLTDINESKFKFGHFTKEGKRLTFTDLKLCKNTNCSFGCFYHGRCWDARKHECKERK